MSEAPALVAGFERVRRRLQGSDDGDRQMVKVLSAVLSDGLAAVVAACAEALAGGVHSANVILNILARRGNPAPVVTILGPDALPLGRRRSPIAPVTIACAGPADGAHEIVELMMQLKLFGMRAAYDEVLATAIKRGYYEPTRVIASHLSTVHPGARTEAFFAQRNTAPKPFRWTFDGYPLQAG